MKIAIFLVLLIFLTACTRVELGKDNIIIKNKEEAAKSNTTLMDNLETRLGEKLPSLESNLDTPEIVESRVIDETESVNFGDVV